MSVVYITSHDENIYNITKSQGVRQKKSPRFRSKYKDKTRIFQLQKSCVKQHATMGLPEEEHPDPHQYLKKGSGKPSYTVCQPEKEDTHRREKYKAKTPTLKELQESFLQKKQEESEKNFIKVNIETVKKMQPKEHPPRVVIDRKGDKIKPIESGLEPIYIHEKVFGKTPKYLVTFNRIKEKEYQMKKDATGLQQPKCRYITRDEREQLLNGLKQNWEELQKQYQGLPILTDTIPKKIRKSRMEADLKQLEKDIVLIERHPYIYVYDDNSDL